jgi:hypothetical protein
MRDPGRAATNLDTPLPISIAVAIGKVALSLLSTDLSFLFALSLIPFGIA